jgi:hypothetical protein
LLGEINFALFLIIKDKLLNQIKEALLKPRMKGICSLFVSDECILPRMRVPSIIAWGLSHVTAKAVKNNLIGLISAVELFSLGLLFQVLIEIIKIAKNPIIPMKILALGNMLITKPNPKKHVIARLISLTITENTVMRIFFVDLFIELLIINIFCIPIGATYARPMRSP